MIKNYGYIPDTIQEEDYVLGALGGEVLQSNGQWIDFLPQFEPQARKFDTNSCTQFGTLNCFEMLFKRLGLSVDENFGERPLAIASMNTREGNSPKRVAETVRKVFGVVKESVLPFDDSLNSWEEYMRPNPLPSTILSEGRKMLQRFDFKHEWVFTTADSLASKQRKLKESLKFSPVGVSVYAWSEGKEYYEKSGNDNHWCALVGYEDGKYWLVYDSYLDDGEPTKKLAWDYDFGQALRYALVASIGEQLSLIDKILKYVFEAFGVIEKEAKILLPPVLNKEEPSMPDSLREKNRTAFASAIQEFEGWSDGSRSKRNLNPGNLKFTSYVRSLGAYDKDSDGFAKFKTYEEGFSALKRFIYDASMDVLKHYHDCTTLSFCASYAPSTDGNKPEKYAEFISAKVGYDTNEKLRHFV